jgi:hypothetical protein
MIKLERGGYKLESVVNGLPRPLGEEGPNFHSLVVVGALINAGVRFHSLIVTLLI